MKRAAKTLEKFAEAQAQERLKKLVSSLRKAAKHPEREDAIHDLRVAARRFKQGLRVFQGLFNSGHVKKMKRQLREVMDACGAVRNCDIARDILRAAGAPASAEVARLLDKRRSRAQRTLMKLLAERTSYRAVRNWKNWIRAEAAKNGTVRANARSALLPLAHEFFKLGEEAVEPQRSPGEMHQFRLLAKRFRYSLEIYGPMAGSEWEQGIEEMRGLQERLGAISDCLTTATLIDDLTHPSLAARQSQTALRRLLKERIKAFRAYWREHFDPKYRKWWIGWLGPARKVRKRTNR